MAIDNSSKRRSASSILSGMFGSSVTPNAGKPVSWRQNAGWGYVGIEVSAPVIVPTSGGYFKKFKIYLPDAMRVYLPETIKVTIG